ncbi:MAG: 50S ribosomal protein L30 [Pseudomonadota bacterium]|jgi:large subunit ribosomal protein L30|nr:50S ribosomal protein L30 [Gammaproteobacteria bacterium]MEC7917592.1 50S ribosomal protein L30 [Pseudomonadota bacterium]|tara:strand:- start:182 stop:358 length:177 start_codon:yes stop_codon:yes gene_type:complete
MAKVKVKLIKSLIGSKSYQKSSVFGLGLSKLGQVVEVEDTPENRGMINKSSHLLEVLD